MYLFGKNLSKKIFVVAEIGNNHEGNINIAKKMIREAKKSGADAVKFQTFIPENYVSDLDRKRLRILKKFQLSFKQFYDLSNYAKKVGINFFSTPLDIKSAKFLNKIQKIFKIASGDNNFLPLIETVASFNKTIILSTGLCNLNEIKKIKKKIFEIWGKNKKKNKLILLHCVSDYPVSSKDANLLAIKTLKKHFQDCFIGYSDHTIGTEAAIAAGSLGASVIEKHFTLDKNFSSFRDHKLSVNPEELKMLTSQLRNLEKMRGSGLKKPGLNESKNIKNFRRAIVAARNIKKGEILKFSDLNWLRSVRGLMSGNESKLINKVALMNFAKGQPFQIKYLRKNKK